MGGSFFDTKILINPAGSTIQRPRIWLIFPSYQHANIIIILTFTTMKMNSTSTLLLSVSVLLTAVNQCAAVCEDKNGRFPVGSRGNKSCDFFLKRPEKRCTFPEAKHCPVKCGTCDQNESSDESETLQSDTECNDNVNRFATTGTTTRTCAWVARKLTAERCADAIIRSNCKATCNACPVVCNDETERFHVPEKNKIKSCEWAAKLYTKERCAIDTVAKKCPVVCGLCANEPSARPSPSPSDLPTLQPSPSPSLSNKIAYFQTNKLAFVQTNKLAILQSFVQTNKFAISNTNPNSFRKPNFVSK